MIHVLSSNPHGGEDSWPHLVAAYSTLNAATRVRSSECSSAIWREETEMSRHSGEPLQSLATSGERQYGSATTRIWNSVFRFDLSAGWRRLYGSEFTEIFQTVEEVLGLNIRNHIKPLVYLKIQNLSLSSQLSTGWKVWGLNLGGGVIFHISPDRSWSSRSHLGNLYRVIAVGKAVHPI
jgi:hypothetical protein